MNRYEAALHVQKINEMWMPAQHDGGQVRIPHHLQESRSLRIGLMLSMDSHLNDTILYDNQRRQGKSEGTAHLPKMRRDPRAARSPGLQPESQATFRFAARSSNS
jgi:hypothetical protein